MTRRPSKGYVRIVRNGEEILELTPLGPAPGRPDGRDCTVEDHANALEDQENIETREFPDVPTIFTACVFCGEILHATEAKS